MKQIFCISCLLIVSWLAQAHEFWLQPNKFVDQIGEKAEIGLLVGEGIEGKAWDLTRHKIEKFTHYSRAGKQDLTVVANRATNSTIEYLLNQQGTSVFTLESNQAFIELDAEKFNAYLEEDGLDNIIAEREKANTTNQGARELYSRYAKLMVQVGRGTDDTYKRRTGMELEIVPDANPYDITAGDYLGCVVYYQGKPLPHTLVKVWSHVGNRIFLQNIYTENDGAIKFPISAKGPWMVSTVKMIKSEKPNTDYESMWASLVFGIE
jgi:uncharacterized GH25 family protein